MALLQARLKYSAYTLAASVVSEITEERRKKQTGHFDHKSAVFTLT